MVEKLIFAALPNDTTLIYANTGFFILYNETLELSPINLGLNIESACTSISYSSAHGGVVALTFRDCDILYVANIMTQKKEIEEKIIDGMKPASVSRDIVNLVNQYRGWSSGITLFAPRHHSPDAPSAAEDSVSMNRIGV